MGASNVIAIRAALDDATSTLESILDAFSKGTSGVYKSDAMEVINAARFVLSAPPRNCDVGTYEEQSERFTKFCGSQDCKRTCPFSDDYDSYRCEFAWSQMPYEEGDENGK